jgi:hypothetical protein
MTLKKKVLLFSYSLEHISTFLPANSVISSEMKYGKRNNFSREIIFLLLFIPHLVWRRVKIPPPNPESRGSRGTL